jgi:hypothetical protein
MHTGLHIDMLGLYGEPITIQRLKEGGFIYVIAAPTGVLRNVGTAGFAARVIRNVLGNGSVLCEACYSSEHQA